jgi:hypothetical protein
MNEDNLQQMADAIKNLDEIDKTATANHKVIKRPY